MAYFLSPIGNDQQCSANGAPLSGGKIYTYLAGTSTPAPTYTDSTSGTQQANPIILNSLGLPASPIWMTGGIVLKFVIKDSADVLIRTIDGVSGINDTSSTASEWTDSGLTPTYISATSFSLLGDQTANFQVNRRVRTKNTAGYIYGRITASVYASTITTVTVLNDSGAIDSGLSLVSYGFISFSPSSMPYGLYAGAGSNTDITSLSGGNALLINSATTSKPIVRQTVLSGPVDTNGLPSFGGSTGSTTVTASGTLIPTAANGYALGGAVDYTGSIVNPSWTGLSTNGTMYLYLDIATNGTCTTGSTTLQPNYQWGGTYSTTSGQFTFNTQEMVGKVGNGATAAQTYRVFVGDVTVAGGVTTAISWYALMGRYTSAWTNTLPSTAIATSANHNIGVYPAIASLDMECITNDATAGFVVGDRLLNAHTNNGGSAPLEFYSTNKTVGFTTGNTNSFVTTQKSTGVNQALANANWKYRLQAQRGW